VTAFNFQFGDDMKTAAVIPTGGTGRRMGGVTPKQYLPLAGIPLLVHTLRTFQNSPSVDAIILVVPSGDIAEVRSNIVDRYIFPKVKAVVAGGRERQDSVRNALAHIDEDNEIVVIHDGVRPLVTTELIELLIDKARKLGAVVTGLDVRDTVKRVDKTGKIAETVSREGLWLTQTPQAFRNDLLIAAYRAAEEGGFLGTDDASLVERAGIPVWMIPGDRENIKVTTKEDLVFCEMILHSRKR
jgi:2-C-methyl-D-erythritol 4-phosphate cytidylyltransferase